MASLTVTFLGTGAGNCVHRAHTAIVLDCADGTRLLLDASSGNSVLRQGAELGMMAEDYHQVLLSHHHADHMAGLPFIAFRRHRVNPQAAPLRVYSTEEALDWLRRMCLATRLNLATVNQDGAFTDEGQQVFRWDPVQDGQWISLGPTTRACTFPADHISGAVGWKVESDGVSVVFSGDTRFSPIVAEAAQGARLLIHEAFCTEREREWAAERGHSTAGQAGQVAAQADVAELIITHIDSPFHADMQPLIDDARGQYGGPITAATDLHQITVATG